MSAPGGVTLAWAGPAAGLALATRAPAAERARAAALHDPGARAQRLAAAGLTAALLARQGLDATPAHDARGALRLAGAALSRSRCPAGVAVALAGPGRLGVDVEPEPSAAGAADWAALLPCFAPHLAGADARAATIAWTALEALAKARRSGLAPLLARPVPLDPALLAGPGQRIEGLLLTTRLRDGLVISLAREAGTALREALPAEALFPAATGRCTADTPARKPAELLQLMRDCV